MKKFTNALIVAILIVIAGMTSANANGARNASTIKPTTNASVAGTPATAERKARGIVWNANSFASTENPTIPSIDELMEGIWSRSNGLAYYSETESPVYTVRVDFMPTVSLTQRTLLQALHARYGNAVEERDINYFFAAQRLHDERWQELFDYLLNNFDDPHVYAVGRVNVNIYVLSIQHGALVGIRMYAVET